MISIIWIALLLILLWLAISLVLIIFNIPEDKEKKHKAKTPIKKQSDFRKNCLYCVTCKNCVEVPENYITQDCLKNNLKYFKRKK